MAGLDVLITTQLKAVPAFLDQGGPILWQALQKPHFLEGESSFLADAVHLPIPEGALGSSRFPSGVDPVTEIFLDVGGHGPASAKGFEELSIGGIP